MKIHVLPFSGFYESLHSRECESTWEHEGMDENGEIDPAHQDKNLDWKKVRTEYARKYTEQFAHVMGLKSLTFSELNSPREYNFYTDVIIADIADEDVRKMLSAVDRENFRQRVAEALRERSGFIPHYSNDLEDWPEDPTTWDEPQLGLLLQEYAEAEDEDIEDCVRERLACNGHVSDILWSAVIEPKAEPPTIFVVVEGGVVVGVCADVPFDAKIVVIDHDEPVGAQVNCIQDTVGLLSSESKLIYDQSNQSNSLQ